MLCSVSTKVPRASLFKRLVSAAAVAAAIRSHASSASGKRLLRRPGSLERSFASSEVPQARDVEKPRAAAFARADQGCSRWCLRHRWCLLKKTFGEGRTLEEERHGCSKVRA